MHTGISRASRALKTTDSEFLSKKIEMVNAKLIADEPRRPCPVVAGVMG